MWEQLAALLQVLHDQPDTVLSELSRKALERCLETGTCNSYSMYNVKVSLRCSCCGEVVGDKWFSISCAIWRYQYIECDECWDKNSGWKQELYDALPEEDRLFMESQEGIIACEQSEEDYWRLDDLIGKCYDFELPDDWEEEDKKSREEMREDEKVVYPNGIYKKAHWERLLEKRGVPMVPVQLGKGQPGC